jgi:CysZ protein
MATVSAGYSSRFATYNSRAANPLYHFIYGVRFYLAGWSLLFRNLPLIGFSIIPIVLTIILLGALAAGSVLAVGQLFADNSPLFGDNLRLLAQTAVLLLVLFVGFLLYLPLARVLLAPFSEALSRRAHAIIHGNTMSSSNLGALRAMWEGAKLVALQLVGGVLALIVSLFIPVIGPVIGILLGSIFCSMDYVDVPLSARGLPLRRKLSVWWQHKSLALGFGAIGYLLLLVPVINLFSLPAGIIGATLLTGRIERDHGI